MLKIISAPNPVLSGTSKQVSKVDSGVLHLIEEMKKTLVKTSDPKGVGLAAPQVGKSLRIFIAKPTDKSPISVFVNPKITYASSAKSSEVSQSERTKNLKKKSGISDNKSSTFSSWSINSREEKNDANPRGKPRGFEKVLDKMLEGCLSLPTVWGEVQRQKEIKLSYLDEFGKKHSKMFTGFPAIIIQHETDHLNGILFPKRVLEQNGKLYKSVKDKKNEDVFEEIEI